MKDTTFNFVSLPKLPPSFPTRRSLFGRAFGQFIHTVLGWKIKGDFPDTPKLVLIVAPHTSNWDAIVGISAALILKLDVRFFVKHQAFKGPPGWLLKKLGGIPVQRDSAHGLVGAAATAFGEHEAFLLGLAPEGTRSREERWKTGFHRIAKEANVPIVLVAMDFKTKTIGPVATITPSDLESDLALIASHLEGVRGRNPELETPAA